MRRSSSSLPGSRIASTWSPACSWVSSSGISALPFRTTEIRRAPSGQLQRAHALPLAVGGLVDRHLDDLEVLLAQLEQLDQPVLGHLVLDQRHDRSGRGDGRRDAEQVEVGLVARVVDARDHLRDAVLLAAELADDDVVLVVAGRRDEQVGRALDPGALEHEHLGGVAADHLVLELGLELVEAVRLLLDQRHLVAAAQQRAGEVRADLAAACDQDVHQAVAFAVAWTASTRESIAADVGQTMRIPRAA